MRSIVISCSYVLLVLGALATVAVLPDWLTAALTVQIAGAGVLSASSLSAKGWIPRNPLDVLRVALGLNAVSVVLGGYAVWAAPDETTGSGVQIYGGAIAVCALVNLFLLPRVARTLASAA